MPAASTCQSGWVRLLSVTHAIEAGACRQGDSNWATGRAPWRGGFGTRPWCWLPALERGGIPPPLQVSFWSPPQGRWMPVEMQMPVCHCRQCKGERPIGAAYGGKGSKGRVAEGSDRPMGTTSCRPQRTQVSCQPPPPWEGTSEAAAEAVRQAVGGGCQSGWGRLLSVTDAMEAGTCRQGDSGWA